MMLIDLLFITALRGSWYACFPRLHVIFVQSLILEMLHFSVCPSVIPHLSSWDPTLPSPLKAPEPHIRESPLRQGSFRLRTTRSRMTFTITVLFRRELDYQVCRSLSSVLTGSALSNFHLLRLQKKYPHGKPADVAALKKSRA